LWPRRRGRLPGHHGACGSYSLRHHTLCRRTTSVRDPADLRRTARPHDEDDQHMDERSLRCRATESEGRTAQQGDEMAMPASSGGAHPVANPHRRTTAVAGAGRLPAHGQHRGCALEESRDAVLTSSRHAVGRDSYTPFLDLSLLLCGSCRAVPADGACLGGHPGACVALRAARAIRRKTGAR
jgi:hypothetical protein